MIDADADGRVLLARTLLSVFPRAAIVECQDLETAIDLLGTHEFDAVVSRRAIGADSEKLVRAIREQRPNVPLLAISRGDRRKQLVLAGATTTSCRSDGLTARFASKTELNQGPYQASARSRLSHTWHALLPRGPSPIR